MHYFNEFNPHAAAWLRELIREGHLPPGEVDERDIREVRADDLRGFTSCHFFAGIGGWDEALRLAGWPVDRPVWTGSCPCQPYSSAGKGLGDADPRNLWPEFFRLIRECRPDTVFGEQVEGAIRKGWLDRVQTDLEGEGYAVGHCVFGAHSVGAPHVRQRLYWVGSTGAVADANSAERRPNGLANGTGERGHATPLVGRGYAGGEYARGVEHPASDRRREGRAEPVGRSTPGGCGTGGLENADGERESSVGGVRRGASESQPNGSTGGLGNANRTGSLAGDAAAATTGHGRTAFADGGTGGAVVGVAQGDADDTGPQGRGVPRCERAGERPVGPTGGVGFWDRYDLIPCRDGKARRTQPGLFPLAHGVSGRVAVVCPGQQPAAANEEGQEVRWVNRVGALRGAGNAIVPQDAAEFVAAFLEVEGSEVK